MYQHGNFDYDHRDVRDRTPKTHRKTRPYGCLNDLSAYWSCAWAQDSKQHRSKEERKIAKRASNKHTRQGLSEEMKAELDETSSV